MGTKKKWKVKPKIVNWIFRFISFILFCYILGMLFFPDTMIKLTGFQFYTVLSGSMEPKIPTYSLVLSKNIKSDDELVPGTIITFHANRLGEDTVLTHTLAKTEVESDGRVRYYTQAYAYEGLDEYHTYRQDIVGIYVMHVPFLGKIVLFLHCLLYTSDIADHHMHSEFFMMDQATADRLNQAKAEGRRIIAVGTTSCRTLEAIMSKYGEFRECHEDTDIFIFPGYSFQAIDGLITNFHLPKSTLVMLVSAFATKDQIMTAYQAAIDEKYRFFSFGDSMFIE